jgi:hypothetical protein
LYAAAVKVTIQSPRVRHRDDALAQAADGLHPAEDLLDQFPFLLADRIARMACRAAVNRLPFTFRAA